jgi:hypothetical protein
MKSLIRYLGCGRVEENPKAAMSYFVVSKFNDITDIIIPFFDKYPIQGVKSLDYLNFKEIASRYALMKEKVHLNIEGIEKIKRIKSKMNRIG